MRSKRKSDFETYNGPYLPIEATKDLVVYWTDDKGRRHPAMISKAYAYIITFFFLLAALTLRSQSYNYPPYSRMPAANLVVKDSLGAVYDSVAWKKMLFSGKFRLKAVSGEDTAKEFLLIPVSESEGRLRQPALPKPGESPYFSTGKKLQNFVAVDISGRKYRLRDLQGKVVVLNFWFIACGPCRLEIPGLNALVDEYGQDSSDVVFLAVGLDEKKAIEKFLQTMPFRYTIIDNGRYMTAIYGITRYPTHAVIDRSGKVLFHTTGYGAGTMPWLRKSIDSALATHEKSD